MADGRISSKTRDRIVADAREGKVPPEHQARRRGAHPRRRLVERLDAGLRRARRRRIRWALRDALPKRMRANILILP
ncbi:MAG: hypothetical protein U0168_13840 [Nannocystaceae bacterium]